MNDAYLMEDLTGEKSKAISLSAVHNIIKRNFRVISKSKKQVDRRRHKRFQVQDSVFVVLRAHWPHFTKVGQITDISMDGLAFSYIAGKKRSNSSSELDILLGNRSFYLDKVPFKTISDCKAPNKVPFSSIEMRRSGVQFGKLTPEQISQLKYFIWNHTTGEV
jgi:hypothetical protein